MRLSTVCLALLLFMAYLSRPVCGAPLSYTAVPIGGNTGAVEPRAINNAGQIAGEMNGNAILWSGGKIIATLAPLSYGATPDSNEARANAINNRGVIVGGCGGYSPVSMSGLYFCTAFLAEDGRMRPLIPGNTGVGSYEAFGINDAGVVVGLDGFRGFYLPAGGKEVTVRPLSHYPEGNGTRCTAINNRGWFVGATTIQRQARGQYDYSTIAQVHGRSVRRILPTTYSVVHAFLCRGRYPAHRLIDLGALPGIENSTATGLNDRGDVVGYTGRYGGDKWASVNNVYHALLWRGGHPHDLGVLPGESMSRANGINDEGLIVGQSGKHAVVWQAGRIYDLTQLVDVQPGLELTNAVAVNARGQIICTGSQSGKPGAWLLTPTLASSPHLLAPASSK